MEQIDNNMGLILGEIGCRFRSNIENHIKDYKLQKEEDSVEWLLEPLELISHPNDLVLDAFRKGDRLGWLYELYFHYRDASAIYVPFNPPYEKFNEYVDIFFDFEDEEHVPDTNPYNKTMLVKGLANWPTIMAVPKIWVDLSVPFTEMGIWQAVLLYKAFTFLPKGWHGNYYDAEYCFCHDDIQQLMNSRSFFRRGFDRSTLDPLNGRNDILPSVNIEGDKAKVTYCYWTNWGGFCRLTLDVEKHSGSVLFGEQERQVLVKYDCGFRF